MSNSSVESDNDGISVSSGLVAIILIIAFALFGGGYLVWIQSPIWFGDFMQDQFESALATSSIADSEQSEMIEVVDQLAARIRDRTIGWADIAEIVQSISESEFAPIAFSLYLQASAVHPLNLSDEERARTHQTILRLEWAVQNKAIPEDELEPLWEMLGKSPRDNESDWTGNEIVLTEEKLREFLAKSEALLAEHEVPLEPFAFDFSESLYQALERYLVIPDSSIQ